MSVSDFCIVIPSYGRVERCNKTVNKLLEITDEYLIYVFVEKLQFNEYHRELKGKAVVVPLPKEEMGVGFSRWFSTKLLLYLGYKYALYIDDDVNVKFNISKYFQKTRNNRFSWVAGKFSIYDFFCKDEIENADGEFYKTRTCFYGSAMIVDLEDIEEVGGWDWRLRAFEDDDIVFRLMKSRKRVVVGKNMDCTKSVSRNRQGGISGTKYTYNGSNEKSLQILKKKYSHAKKLFHMGNKKDGSNIIKINRKIINDDMGNIRIEHKSKTMKESDLEKYDDFIEKQLERDFNV